MSSAYKGQWVKFYADLEGSYLNKLFTFRVNNPQHARGCLKRFEAKGNRIRAAWYIDGLRGASERL